MHVSYILATCVPNELSGPGLEAPKYVLSLPGVFDCLSLISTMVVGIFLLLLLECKFLEGRAYPLHSGYLLRVFVKFIS